MDLANQEQGFIIVKHKDQIIRDKSQQNLALIFSSIGLCSI